MKFKMRVTVAVGTAALLGGSAVAVAQTTTTPSPTTTTPTAPAPTSPAPTTPGLPAGIIAPNVRVAGVDVSGLTQAQARAKVLASFAPRLKPYVIVVRGRRVLLNPRTSGYSADIPRAVRAALNVGRSQPAGPVDIPVTQRVNQRRLRQILQTRANQRRVPARDAATNLRGRNLVTVPARAGVEVDVDRSVRLLTNRMTAARRSSRTVVLPTRRVLPSVRVAPAAVLIDRGRFRLTVVSNGRRRTFPVAVGMPGHSTPSGNFRVITKQVNPTWTPPDSRWAAGMGPVPPGPGNPLGTRWIGVNSPGIGIHGTPAPGTIGTRASHGCIRMYIRDVEAFYRLVSIGTPVYIR